MKLCSEWLDFSDLSVIEAAYLLLGADRKSILYRSERDDAYADYCHTRDLAEDASYKCDALLVALHTNQLATTEEHSLASGEYDCIKTRILMSSFVMWCRSKPHLQFVVDALSPMLPPESVSNVTARDIVMETTDAAESPCGIHTNEDKAPSATTTKHRIGTRTNILKAVIDLAIKKAIAQDDPHSVWAELVKMANSDDRPAPLLGFIDDEGVKYQAFDSVRFFTQKQLRDRMARKRAKAC